MDIDGTLADWSKRLKAAGPEPKNRGPAYEAWLKLIQSDVSLAADEPVNTMRELCNSLADGKETRLVYLTARSEDFYMITRSWLKVHLFPEANILMRPSWSKSKSGYLKNTLIKAYLATFDKEQSVMVIDDDPNGDVEKMCKRNGYTFLKARSASVD